MRPEAPSKGWKAGWPSPYRLAHDAVGKYQLGQNMRGLATIMTDPRSGRLLSQFIEMKPNSSQAPRHDTGPVSKVW